MSIDARVKAVMRNKDGSGAIRLGPRPGNPAGSEGQPALTFQAGPGGLGALVGLDLWGGDSDIMLGETTIARRVDATAIEFHPGSLDRAIEKFSAWKPATA